MSGCGSSCNCPNCGAEADLYMDWKPFEYSSIFCFACGLSINPCVEFSNLTDLNNERDYNDMNPLDELPEQSFEM